MKIISSSPHCDKLEGTLRHVAELCEDYGNCKTLNEYKAFIDKISNLALDSLDEYEVGTGC